MRPHPPWLLAAVTIVLALAVIVIAFPPTPGAPSRQPHMVSCTAATRCVQPDQSIPTDHLDYPRE